VINLGIVRGEAMISGQTPDSPKDQNRNPDMSADFDELHGATPGNQVVLQARDPARPLHHADGRGRGGSQDATPYG